jgi:DNA relaxase NicK
LTCEKEIEFVSFGIDWLTCTMNTPSTCIRAAKKAATLVRSEVSKGNVKKPWGMSGFSGWKAGEVQFGKRDDEVLVRLSGYLAHTNWRSFYALANNTSRLDVECTTRTAQTAEHRIRRHLREARKYAAKRKKKPFVGRYSGNDDSETIYLNRRVGMQMGRIYDKGRESRKLELQDCVRYEVEFKQDMARVVAAELFASESESVLVCGRVASFFRDRGIALPSPWVGGNHSGCHRSRSDSDRRLEWLQRSVSPSLALLVRAGKLNEVLVALDLQDLVTPNENLRVHSSRRNTSYVS